MKTTVSMKNGKLTIYLKGELDHNGAREVMFEIERHIEENKPRDCILDMAGVSFMDSSGIAVILKTYKRVYKVGGRIWVENVPPQPMRVLDAAGVERLIRISILAE